MLERLIRLFFFTGSMMNNRQSTIAAATPPPPRATLQAAVQAAAALAGVRYLRAASAAVYCRWAKATQPLMPPRVEVANAGPTEHAGRLE